MMALLVAYAALTGIYATWQWLENRQQGRNGPFWAPVWWIALTWPAWLVVIALDLRWGPHWPGRR